MSPRKGFRRVACPGDGRCFYHAVATCLNHAGRGDWSAERVFRAVQKKHPGASATWADDLDVARTADALGLSVHVWEGANRMWIEIGDGPLRIALHNASNTHFDALVPAASRPRG